MTLVRKKDDVEYATPRSAQMTTGAAKAYFRRPERRRKIPKATLMYPRAEFESATARLKTTTSRPYLRAVIY